MLAHNYAATALVTLFNHSAWRSAMKTATAAQKERIDRCRELGNRIDPEP